MATARSELSGRRLLVLAGCAIGLTLNIATVFSGSLTAFMKPISADTGWTRAEVSLGLSMAMLPLLLLLPWVGRMADRLGPRRVIAVGAPLFSVVLASLGWLPASYPLYLACCVLLGITAAATYNSIYYALLPHWFDQRLGLAVGIASAGTGLGLILSPLVSQELISALGWRAAYGALGAITCVVVLPASLLLLRDPPEAPAERKSDGVSAATALKSLRFWRIASTYFLTGLAINGTVIHLVPLLTDRGMPAGQAALLASYLGFGVLVSRIVSGMLLDFVDAGLLGAASFVLAAMGIGLLTLPQTELVATAGVLLVGTALGAEGGVLSYVTRRVFGIQAYGAVIGSMMAAFLAGVLIGPLVSGAVFDATGAYQLALYGFAAMALVAAGLHATVTLRRNQSPAT